MSTQNEKDFKLVEVVLVPGMGYRRLQTGWQQIAFVRGGFFYYNKDKREVQDEPPIWKKDDTHLERKS